MEPEIHWSRFQLLSPHRRVRRRWHDRVLSSFSKGRTALFCTSYSGRRCSDHGRRGNCVLSRTTIVAEDGRCSVCDCWFIFAAQINPSPNNRGPNISLHCNTDQLIAFSGHPVHSENVTNSRSVVLVLERIGLQRRCFL